MNSHENFPLWEGHKVPADISDQIVDCAIDLVDQHKEYTRQTSSLEDTAIFYVGAYDNIGSTLPTLAVSVPHEATHAYPRRAQFTFGFQDASRSHIITVDKNGGMRRSFCDGRRDQRMDIAEAEAFRDELLAIKDTLVPDIDVA